MESDFALLQPSEPSTLTDEVPMVVCGAACIRLDLINWRSLLPSARRPPLPRRPSRLPAAATLTHPEPHIRRC